MGAAGTPGAGAGHPSSGTGDAGGAMRVRQDPAGLVKYACATSADRFRIEEQKSDVAGTATVREPEQPRQWTGPLGP
jgi:hypothetical protein